MRINRRKFLSSSAAIACLSSHDGLIAQADQTTDCKLKYLLGSCLYGYTDVAKILPEVAKTQSVAIDIWPKVHGNQREQLDELGEEKFIELLNSHNVPLGCITQYKLGPFGLQDEMRLAKRLGCQTIVTGAIGPKNLKGSELRKAVEQFVEQLKPHLAVAEETGITIAIENHADNLIESPDSLRYLAELSPSNPLAIAFAPYHLPQEESLLAKLLEDVIPKVAVFYAWQHGKGCMKKLPKQEELLQMPGRGRLDFGPLIDVLKQTQYQGWTEIFMHPFPRGIPILDTTEEVTAEINHARTYLDTLHSV